MGWSGRKEPAGVAAYGHAGAVEGQDVLVIGGVLGHVGDELPAGVSLSYQVRMNGRQGLLWKRVRQHMGHLGRVAGVERDLSSSVPMTPSAWR